MLVHKELLPIKDAIGKNDNILRSLLDKFVNVNLDSPRVVAFKSEIQTHVSLLGQISDSVNIKYKEITSETQNYAYRNKRGIFNGAGTIWKSITGNLDASDGEYFNNCIEKLSRDEHHFETLLKNQISVTTSVIKSFNSTIQKLQIDEETFNSNLDSIQKTMMNISDELAFYKAEVETLDLCESLMESYSFLENTLNDILNAITFARLKILHSSIITPLDLIESLKQISQSLQKNNLPLPVYSSSLAKYIDIIELEAYQSESKVIFVLKIPLVEPETYTMYHLYPIPIPDNRTGFHHIISTTQKYIAKDDDSMLYVSPQNPDNCKSLSRNQKICSEMLPHPIDSESICEAQLLKSTIQELPKTCRTSLLLAEEYNVQEIDINLWLVSVSDPLPITIKCEGKEATTTVVQVNSLLKLRPDCNAFVGSTRVQAKRIVDVYQTVEYRNLPIEIPYKCCQHLPDKPSIPDLKPLKLSKINTDDLNIAQHKLDQYSDELDKIMNQPFVDRHLSWFTITTIVIIVITIGLYLLNKCRRKGRPMITMSNDDPPPSPKPPQRKLRRLNFGSILPRRRPSIHLDDSFDEGTELQA